MRFELIVVLVFSVFLVSAVAGGNLSANVNVDAGKIKAELSQNIQEHNAEMEQLRLRLENESEEFRQRIMNETQEMRERMINNSIQTRVRLESEINESHAKLVAQLSNGRRAEVKIMPETASERALERLRLKVCSAEENNCTIELKEVGQNGTRTELRLAYELKAEKQAKVFGFIKTRMNVESQVDAETRRGNLF
ncbi:MAG: hypothetical protein WC494_01295 [Candidatus Pacearchaeota archaeon]